MRKPAHAKPIQQKAKSALPAVLLAFLGMFCVLSTIWTFSQWEKLSVTEVIFTLRALKGTGNGMIEHFVLTVLLPSLVFGILVYIVLRLWRTKRGFSVVRRLVMLAGILATLGSFGYLWHGMGVTNYLLHIQTDEDFIADNYVDPNEVTVIFPETKRNLIYLYLESMEVTYTDKAHGGSFEKSYIPELTDLGLESESFSGDKNVLNGAFSLPDTTWTTGAMVAHTSGLPLKIPIDGNGMGSQETFFPTITALGDMLQDEGYDQTLFIGSYADFGARSLYFTTHGEYKMHDYPYAKEQKRIPEDYQVWWGYEDEKLFEFAKQELTDLAKGDAPFNFTMLTVDTHFPNGYTCHLCRDDFESEYGNVLACSSRQVAAFIEWCKQQDFYKDTTIVVVGDHPTMDTSFASLIEPGFERRVYTAFINMPEGVQSTGAQREYSTFDMFPTTLAALGVAIEGEKLGLGTNLFSDTQTMLEQMGRDVVVDKLQYPSAFMESVAAIDEDTLMKQEQFARADVSVQSTVAKDKKFIFEVQINPDDVERINNMHAFIEPKETKKVQEHVLVDEGEGRYSFEVDMTAFENEGSYVVQLKPTTDAGKMDYGSKFEIDPSTGTVSEFKEEEEERLGTD